MRKIWIFVGLISFLGGCCSQRKEEVFQSEKEEMRKSAGLLDDEAVSKIEDFFDNTENYAGDTVVLELVVTSSVFAKEGHSLKNLLGGVAEFHLFVPDTSRNSGIAPWNVATGQVYQTINPEFGEFPIKISIPRNLSVPRAAFGHKVLVVFICGKGHLEDGNTAIKIQRPGSIDRELSDSLLSGRRFN